MLNWIAENAATIVTSLVLLAAVIFTVRAVFRARKSGGCAGCSGHCGGCPARPPDGGTAPRGGA